MERQLNQIGKRGGWGKENGKWFVRLMFECEAVIHSTKTRKLEEILSIKHEFVITEFLFN